MSQQPYRPTWESVRTHTVPTWYDDAKFGIFIHWGLYSVPAWAEKKWELGGEPSPHEWFRHNSYAEWYQNTIGIQDSAARARHVEIYGADYPYGRFAGGFACELWDPARWAGLFKEAGARYVVLTTKHHDGFCLYPSAYTDYNSVKLGPRRDLTGELSQAVRNAGLRMGHYYSGLLDWTFGCRPILTADDFRQDYTRTQELADYSRNQVLELIDRYRPSVLWGDIGWPEKGECDLPGIFAHYYNTVPEGLVNDRWNNLWSDFRTAEYLHGVQSTATKWEKCRGMGLSFGYNQNEGDDTILSTRSLAEALCECVSTNGNLLLNIGPRADGTIPDIQVQRLKELGAWLKRHGEAIYETRPCGACQCETLDGGVKAYYTQKGTERYALLCGLKPGSHAVALPAWGAHVRVEAEDDMPVHVRIGACC